MRHAVLLALVVQAINLQAADASPRETVKLLTIGNSFANDALHYLPQFANAEGKTVMIFRANLGGHSFEQHASYVDAFEKDPQDPIGRAYKKQPHPKTGERQDFSLKEALEADDWDFVTIQQFSNLSFKAESFEPHAGKLIEYIRKHAPKAEILIHQTWAWREDAPAYKAEDFSLKKMHSNLVAAYRQLQERHGLRIIPVGEAFHAARQSPNWTFKYPDPNFNYENPPEGQLPDQTGSLNIGWIWGGSGDKRKLLHDIKHANEAGKYLAAAVFYEVLFGEPLPESAGGFKGGMPEQAADLRRIAHETVAAHSATAAAGNGRG